MKVCGKYEQQIVMKSVFLNIDQQVTAQHKQLDLFDFYKVLVLEF